MAAKRKSRSRRSRRGRRNTRTTGVSRTLGFPDTQVVRMRYVGPNLQVTTGITPGYRLFRGNSLNDPDQTGSGHQAMGLDQWGAFYDKYLVLGCAWKATFVNGGSNDHFKVACIPKDENTVITAWPTLAERAYCKRQYGGQADSANSIQVIKGYMSTKKILGLKEVATQNEPFTSLINANPTNQWYIHCYAQAVNEVSAFTVFVNIELTYYVRLFDRKPLPQS